NYAPGFALMTSKTEELYRRMFQELLDFAKKNDQEFSLLIRHIPALAFLSSSKIPQAFDELKLNVPPEANNIIQ
ncbi:12424_t:CDS:2, partial [Gigaspora margarita]